MNIVYQESSGLLLLSSSEISGILGNLAAYTSVSVVGTINCGSVPVEKNIVIANIQDDTQDFYFDTGILYLSPSFFGLQTFVDCVVTLSVKVILASGGYDLSTNCIFIDITYKCKVAGLMHNIVEENQENTNTEKVSTIVHLMHYALTNGSNCGCNCPEMCQLFSDLTKLLTTVDPKTVNPCGCQ